MAWQKLGSTTLTGTASTIDVTVSESTTFYAGLFNNPGTGANGFIRSGNSTIDTGGNYAYRSSRNGAADGTAVSQSTGIRVNDNAGSSPNFTVFYMINISGEEKLVIAFTIEQMTAGAGTAPNRNEAVGKHAFTSNPIDIIQMNQSSMPIDTNLSILGFVEPPPFAPSDIAGLKLWLDADDAATITESGNLVSQWDDKSGQGNDVSEATNKPTVVASSMNGKPTIQFDGVNDTLSRATFTAGAISQNITIFMVYNHTLNAGTRMFFESSVANNIVSFWNNTTPEYGIDAGTGLIEEPPSPSVPTGDVFRHDLYSGASSFSKFANVTILSGNAGTNSMDGIFLASENDKTNHMEIDFAEILIYDSDITGADFAKIQTYLADKWGVTTS